MTLKYVIDLFAFLLSKVIKNDQLYNSNFRDLTIKCLTITMLLVL